MTQKRAAKYRNPSVRHVTKPARELSAGETLVQVKDSAGNVWRGRRLLWRVELLGKRVLVWFDRNLSQSVTLWFSDTTTVESMPVQSPPPQR